MNDLDYAVPRRLDESAKLLWWDADEFIAGACAMGFGALSGSFLLGALLCFAAVYGLSRLKAGGGPGHLRRTIYWLLPARHLFGLIRTPPSHIREFVG